MKKLYKLFGAIAILLIAGLFLMQPTARLDLTIALGLASSDDLLVAAQRAELNGNRSKSFDLFLMSAKLGNANAQQIIGLKYKKGDGVTTNLDEAFKWYKSAADQGLPVAQENLGSMYSNGWGATKDDKAAFFWFSRAAESGHPSPVSSVAKSYYYGKGVAQDYVAARQWFDRAASQGHAESNSYLGAIYQLGQGTEKDLDRAGKLYSLAAKGGDAKAIQHLDQLSKFCTYAKSPEAIRAFTQTRVEACVVSANAGNATSQYMVGALHLFGHHLPRDQAIADTWFALAAKNGFAPAQQSVKSRKESSATTCVPQLSWPLPTLNKGEREARLRFIMNTQDYLVAKHREPITAAQCDELLASLADPSKTVILEPDAIATSRDDDSVPDDLIARCDNIGFDRAWFSHTKGPLTEAIDPEFDALPLIKKDEAADSFIRKWGPIEFYDLSESFGGKKIWGSIAEEGDWVCKSPDENLCPKQIGYQKFSTVVIAPVVDSGACVPILLPKAKGGGRFIVGTKNPYAYKETPSFVAFVTINKKPYRIGLTSVPWADFHQLLDATPTTLVVEAIDDDQPSGLCVYEGTTRKEGE